MLPELRHAPNANRSNGTALAAIGLLLALSCGPSRDTSAAAEGNRTTLGAVGGWKYWIERRAGKGSIAQLSYQGREVHFHGSLTTPFGTLVEVSAEEPRTGSGWAKHTASSSVTIEVFGVALTGAELAAGFYSSDGKTKRPGTPDSWVYVGRVVNPGWAAPERLFDVSFAEEHRFRKDG